MLYDYQYDVAAVFITIILFGVFIMRRSFLSRTNIIFSFLIIFDGLAALVDVISCFLVSYPELCSREVNNLFVILYLLFYNLMSVLYLRYIDAKGKLEYMRIPVLVASYIMIAFYLVTIISSPWTHWVFYFEEDMTYMHGPLMNVLYVLPFLVFIWDFIILFKAREQLNKYQISASIALVVMMVITIGISILYPRLLVGQFFMSVILFFIYVAYENPAYYTYKDTQCLNMKAFNDIIKKLQKRKIEYDLVCFSLTEYDYLKNDIGPKAMGNIDKQIADFLYRKFKKSVFCIGTGEYIIINYDTARSKEVKDEIEYYMSNLDEQIESSHHIKKLNLFTCIIDDLNSLYSAEDVELLTSYKLRYKDAGTASYYFLEEVLESKNREQKIINAILKGLEDDNFQVFYQPIYHVDTDSFRSAEALLRLTDEELGYINPEELVVLAERMGYIDRIGDIVFEKVCRFIHDNEIEKYGIHYIEVNLSPVQCERSDIVDIYLNLMNKYGVKPSQINLEITETANMVHEKQILDNISRFHEAGISFSIDDYGSGFASSDYLIKLPVSLVKIDKSILWAAMENKEAMIVLKNTIRMIKEIGKEIVVEGIETSSMAEVLKKYGCDYNQGFYYCKPIPMTEYIDYVKNYEDQKLIE